MQVLFSQENNPSVFQWPHDFSIFFRDAILEHSAGGGRADSGRIDEVLQRQRYPVQGPTPISMQDFFFGLVRLRERRV